MADGVGIAVSDGAGAWLLLAWADAEAEAELLERLDDLLAREVAGLVQGLRSMDLYKVPGVAETLDWARSLAALGATRIDSTLVNGEVIERWAVGP